MAVALTTKLDAVNKCLESVWETPVSSLDVSGVASVALAKRIVDATSRLVQSRGWAFNTDHDYTLTPDDDGFINIPTNTLSIDPEGDSVDVDAVPRGTRLYDREDHTFVFTESVDVKLVTLLEFDDCPEAFRAYVAIQAARTFRDKWLQKDTPSNPTQEEIEALRNLEDTEADQADLNMFTGSNSVARILDRF